AVHYTSPGFYIFFNTLLFLTQISYPFTPITYTTLFRSYQGRDAERGRQEVPEIFNRARDWLPPRYRERANLDDRCDTNGEPGDRSEEHTSELQSREKLVCRLLLEKKKSHYSRHKKNYRY